jgi:hypothetical protein
MSVSESDARTIRTLAERLMRAAWRTAEMENSSEEDLEVVAEAATEYHWPDIERAFDEHDVPVPAELRVLYGITLGIDSSFNSETVLCPPFSRATLGQKIWDSETLNCFMDSHHLSLDFREGLNEAKTFVMIGRCSAAGLTVCDRGRWSAIPYDGDGGDRPKHEDFCLTFVDAFEIFVKAQLVKWALNVVEIETGEKMPFITRVDQDNLPPAVRSAYDRLVAPLDMSAFPRAKVKIWS